MESPSRPSVDISADHQFGRHQLKSFLARLNPTRQPKLMCRWEGLIYPVLVVEAAMVGAFFHGMLVYASSLEALSSSAFHDDAVWVTVVLLLLFLAGLGALSALAYAIYSKRAKFLYPYILWCITIHLTVGPAVAMWTLHLYLEAQAAATGIDYFYIVALIVQFILGTLFLYVAWKVSAFYRKFALALAYYTGLRRGHEFDAEGEGMRAIGIVGNSSFDVAGVGGGPRRGDAVIMQ